MKRSVILALAGFATAIFFAEAAFSQQEKELRMTGTHYYGHTPKVIGIDQDRMIIKFETLGIRVNDTGDGPFHEASVHIIGIMYKGKDGMRLRGFETWTDSEGDKLVWELVEKPVKNAAPGTSSGTAKVLSGSGKYAGMQGSMDWVVRRPKAFPKGTGRGICREDIRLLPAN